jgi:hypothetical protein
VPIVIDFASQIRELQDDFQRVADLHPWVDLNVPPWEGKQGLLAEGDADADPPGPRLGLALHTGVQTAVLHSVISRLYDLTRRAQRLLSRVLEKDTAIPLGVKQGIREWEQQFCGGGWLRWLWAALPVGPSAESGERQSSFPPAQARQLADLGRHRPVDPCGGFYIGNYALAAALALSLLDEAVSATSQLSCPEEKPHPAGPDGGRWLWWENHRYAIPQGRVYRLIEYMWNRDSARYDCLIRSVFDDPVTPQTIRSCVNRVNKALPSGFRWRLSTDSENRQLVKVLKGA